MTDCREIMQILESLLIGKEGIIFDMDGTLLDSMTMWRELDNRYLRGFGIEPDEEYNKTVSSLTLPTAAVYICNRYGNKVPYTPEEVLAQIMELIDDSYRNSLLVKPKVPPVVRELKRRGLKMFVATANEYELCEISLSRNGIMQYMEGIITCTMAGAGKEQPTIYYKACDMMGITAGKCIVFEDTLHSVKTAKAAGFTVVGVYDEDAKSDWSEICAVTDAQVSFE